MDVQILANLFATTYSPDPNARMAAELEIKKVSSQAGMITALLQIIANDGVELATRQACSVYLKNRVRRAYQAGNVTTRQGHIHIPEADRDALKSHILPLLVASPHKSISAQLGLTLKSMISVDFPSKWPGLLDTVKQLLASSDVREVTAGCIAVLEIVKVYRFQQGDTKKVLPMVVEATFPQLASLGAQLLASTPSGPSQDVPTVLHLILKAYKTSLDTNICPHQQSPDSIVPWGRLLFQVINVQVPQEAVPEDEEEREQCEWWKAKKWACSVLGTLFHKYGNPSQMPSPRLKEYKAFAEHFVSNFAPEIFKMYLQQIEALVSGQTWISNKCQSRMIGFFTECIKPKSTWILLKPHFETLVSSYLFPILSCTPAKQVMWSEDSIEFVRMIIDEYEDFSAPVAPAVAFIGALVTNRTKTAFTPTLTFAHSMLGSNATPQQKYGALTMLSALAPFTMRHPLVRPNMESFLVTSIAPLLTSSEAYNRMAACEFIYGLEKIGMAWASEENLLNTSRGIALCLDDAEIPVRVQAVLALTEMISTHTSVKDAVGPQIGKVMQDLLKLSEETDLDILNHCMEVIVEQYSDAITPVATELTARLCVAYERLLRDNIANETFDLDNDLADPGSLAGDDDKTFNAMGIAKTIHTIVSSLESSPDVLAQVEQIIIPVIAFTFENKQLDLFDNMYDLLDSLTFIRRSISPQMWPLFELTYKLFKSDAVDFLDEMLPSLDNYLSYGQEAFQNNPQYKEMILDIYTTAMRSESLGENDRVNACKLIESYMLNLRGHVDAALQTIIRTAMSLAEPESKELVLANLETLINAVLYNPSAALQIMESEQQGGAPGFFDKWFAAVQAGGGLPRVHDKKLSIMAMCALLEMDPSAVPASLQAGWSGIVAGALQLFKELPEAISKRKELEELLKADADEDDEELGDAPDLDLEDNDEADVRDEETEYIEMLAREGERLRSQAEANGGDLDDESVESSDIDEEIGYISPLDSVDPYGTFKQALTTFQMKNGAGYQAATTSLNVEQQALLIEVMGIAEKNAASANGNPAV